MDRRVNAGSVQAVANYVRAGDEFGYKIALYGRKDPRYPSIRFSTDLVSFDYVVFIIESDRSWMSGLRMPRILMQVPRHRRVIVDTDGTYNQLISVDNYDRNHMNECQRRRWLLHHEIIGDKIFQPTVTPIEPGVLALPFFGFDPASVIPDTAAPKKRFDVLHVGHNWWRWREVSGTLLPAIGKVRPHMNGVCFIGSWWDAPPAAAKELDLEGAFAVDNAWLRRLDIQVNAAVPYTHVTKVMSEGRINIMTQRPLLRRLKFLTSKYFEIFCADTIPLVMLDPDHAESVYGPCGRELALHDSVAEKLLDVLSRRDNYWEIVQEVRRHLAANHSYHSRLEDLCQALQS